MPLRKHGTLITVVTAATSSLPRERHGHRTRGCLTGLLFVAITVLLPVSASAADRTEAAAVVSSAAAGTAGLSPTTTSNAIAAVEAGVGSPTATCPAQPASKAFAKVGDDADYSLAPGGNFESGTAGWTFKGGAGIVSGNEGVGVTTGSKSLRLPPMAVAISPQFCVDDAHPSFRFVTRADSLLSGYMAIVLYRDADGRLAQAQFNASASQSFLPSGRWVASDKAPLSVNIPLLAHSSTATAQIMLMSNPVMQALSILTLGLTGTVSFDSVMIDPYRRG